MSSPRRTSQNFGDRFFFFFFNVDVSIRLDLNFLDTNALNEPKGLNKDQINEIAALEWKNCFMVEESNKKRIVLKKNTMICSVCMQNLGEGESVRKLKCGHFFHMECIDQWLKQNAICPLDRVKLKK